MDMSNEMVTPLREGKFIHVVEVTTPGYALASLERTPELSELRDIRDRFVVIETCRTYPAPMRLVKIIWSGDDQAAANRIAQGSAMTYGATFLPTPIHDRATCQHEDCRWARMSEDQRRNLEAFGRDADRIDATPGRYW